MPGTWVGEGPGGRRCRARRRRHSILADPACDSEVVGEGAPVVARKRSLAVRETILIVVRPGVPAADDDGRAIMSGDVLCRRRVMLLLSVFINFTAAACDWWLSTCISPCNLPQNQIVLKSPY